MEEKCQLSPNTDILQSIYVMRRASLICYILQSLSLSLFVITYNIEVVFYLPILWSVSNVIFAGNFIRNRLFISSKIKLVQCSCAWLKYIKSVRVKVNIKPTSTSNQSATNEPPESNLVGNTTAGYVHNADDDDDEDGMVVLDERAIKSASNGTGGFVDIFQNQQGTINLDIESIRNMDLDNDNSEGNDNLSALPRFGHFHSNPVFSNSEQISAVKLLKGIFILNVYMTHYIYISLSINICVYIKQRGEELRIFI